MAGGNLSRGRLRLSITGALAVGALAAWFMGEVVAKPRVGALNLTAAQVVEKNIAARGGRDAWRKIETMVWVGHLEVAEGAEPRLAFVLEQKRPNKTHFEIATLGHKTMRVFDGARGWKVRPNRDGTLDAQPYSAPEVKFAREAQGIEGPLIDYQAKGIGVELAGTERVEGRQAYRLNVRLASGDRHAIWIDAQTFLDVKYDRTSYSATGKPGIVSVFYRNYQTVDGLQIPMLLEIGVGSGRTPDKMVIDKIALNPPVSDDAFVKPAGARRGRMATVDVEPQ
ncbi:MAG: hypothetical protein NVSMB15_00480 [Steroidobacteraceae bacterium]